MGVDFYVWSIMGFKIDAEKFQETIPSKTEKRPAYCPDTGTRLPDKIIIVEEERKVFFSPDGVEHECFEELADHLSAKYPTMHVIPHSDRWNDEHHELYVGPMLEGAMEEERHDPVTVFGKEQEISEQDFAVLDDIAQIFKDAGIEVGQPKLHIITDVSY